MKTKIIEKIETMLQQRTDFVEAMCDGPSDDPYLKVALRDESGSHILVIHPFETDEGSVLRVCHLTAAKAPSIIRVENLCRDINKKMWFGRFESKDNSFTYVAHQMQSSSCPDAPILHRLVSDTVAAAVFCRKIIQELVELALEDSSIENRTADINPALN